MWIRGLGQHESGGHMTSSFKSFTMNIAKISMSLALGLFAMATATYAAVVTYTDRMAFEAALSTFLIDDLAGIAGGLQTSADRGDCTIAAPNGLTMFGCVNNPTQCGGTPAGLDGIHLQHHPGEDTFTFDTAINGSVLILATA